MSLRVVIAHEWLVRYAGSERCVAEIIKVFPDAQLLTTIVAAERVPQELARAKPSVLQWLPGASNHHEWLLPLMPIAWRLMPRQREVDVVISSSHACANAVPVGEGIPHVCYCHTPMRYAWDFRAEQARFPAPLRPLARIGSTFLRSWDRRTASTVTHFIANSRAVALRIRRFYGRSARVIHPPVRTDFFTPGAAREDFFLFVGRLVAYKRPDLVVDAFAGVPHQLMIVGQGHMEQTLRRRATSNVEFLSDVNDCQLRELYRSARALIYPGEEDFGLVMAEAQACGTPVIALHAGGAMDIVEHGRTGWLIGRQHEGELRRAVAVAATDRLDSREIRSSAERFSSARFRAEIEVAVRDVVANRPAAI